MADRKVTAPSVVTYTVTFRDGSTKTIVAKNHEYGEYGVTFTGRKFQQGSKQAFIAFVPYGDLRMVEEQVDE